MLYAIALFLFSSFSSSEVFAAQEDVNASWASHHAALVEESRANIARLAAQADQIIGLEAIVAEGSDNAFYSRFGHAMLRFVKADGDFSTDSILSFVATVDQGQINAIKGLVGGYHVFPVVQPLGNFWQEYVHAEERPLSRYLILSTPDLRRKLFENLRAWIENPDLSGDYTFLHNNCVGVLAKLLEDSGFPNAPGFNPVIPTHLEEWLADSLLSPVPVLRVDSLKPLLRRVADALRVKENDLVSGLNWPADAATTLSAGFSDLEIKRLLLELSAMPDEVRMELLHAHRFGNGGASLEDVMMFKPVPARLYETCAHDECIQEIISLAKQLWPEDEWENAIRADDFAYAKSVNAIWGPSLEPYAEPISKAPRCIRRALDFVLHYQLLLKLLGSRPRLS